LIGLFCLKAFRPTYRGKKYASLPSLAKVAKRVFSIHSGSANAERIFSTADRLSWDHHMSVKPQTLAKLVFLKMDSNAL
jgi:hypothetical protein